MSSILDERILVALPKADLEETTKLAVFNGDCIWYYFCLSIKKCANISNGRIFF